MILQFKHKWKREGEWTVCQTTIDIDALATYRIRPCDFNDFVKGKIEETTEEVIRRHLYDTPGRLFHETLSELAQNVMPLDLEKYKAALEKLKTLARYQPKP
jgi:hypothetical protein